MDQVLSPSTRSGGVMAAWWGALAQRPTTCGVASNDDVLALQEAGPVPPLDPDGDFHYQDSTTVNGYTIHHCLRDFDHDPAMPRHMCFLETDPNGHRNNLAMVTEAGCPPMVTAAGALLALHAGCGGGTR